MRLVHGQTRYRVPEPVSAAIHGKSICVAEIVARDNGRGDQVRAMRSRPSGMRAVRACLLPRGTGQQPARIQLTGGDSLRDPDSRG